MNSDFIMNINKYNRYNFHQHTYCVFLEIDSIEMENQKVDFKSKSGSSYFFTEAGVYRLSNHWGRAANCKWRLQKTLQTTSRTKLGFALWTSFHPDNATEKYYGITVDLDEQLAYYQHKDSSFFDENVVLRNASETTKRLKQIRNLWATTTWAKHFEVDDVDFLRKAIIEKLITTNQSLQQIKSNLRHKF